MDLSTQRELQHRAYWTDTRRREFDNVVNAWRNNLQAIETDPDPRNQAPEVKAYLKGRLKETSIPAIRQAAKELLDQWTLGVKESHEAYHKREAEWERYFDPARVANLREEWDRKMALAGPGDIDRMTAHIQARGDPVEARAFRAALMGAATRFKQSSQMPDKLWANRIPRIVREWESADEPADLKELRDTAGKWSADGNALRQQIFQLGQQLDPPQPFKGGIFDDLLGLEQPGVVYHPKDGSLTVEGDDRADPWRP